jgi:hypothetical protein
MSAITTNVVKVKVLQLHFDAAIHAAQNAPSLDVCIAHRDSSMQCFKCAKARSTWELSPYSFYIITAPSIVATKTVPTCSGSVSGRISWWLIPRRTVRTRNWRHLFHSLAGALAQFRVAVIESDGGVHDRTSAGDGRIPAVIFEKHQEGAQAVARARDARQSLLETRLNERNRIVECFDGEFFLALEVVVNAALNESGGLHHVAQRGARVAFDVEQTGGLEENPVPCFGTFSQGDVRNRPLGLFSLKSHEWVAASQESSFEPRPAVMDINHFGRRDGVD